MSAPTSAAVAASSPRRVTPTERLYDALMASLARVPSPPESSVSMSRNARGVAQFEVVVRGGSPRACEDLAREIYERLALAFPYPAANGGTE